LFCCMLVMARYRQYFRFTPLRLSASNQLHVSSNKSLDGRWHICVTDLSPTLNKYSVRLCSVTNIRS
jgi:hypothetical protein